MDGRSQRGVSSLAEDLVATDSHSFLELAELAVRSIREVGIGSATHTAAQGAGVEHYWLLSFPNLPNRKVRPVNSHLFVSDVAELERMVGVFGEVFKDIHDGRAKNTAKAGWATFIGAGGIPRTLYTIQQGISIGLDCFLPENQSRKRAGQYFEDLFSSLMDLLSVEQRRLNFRLPIPGIGDTTFNIEVDRVINTHGPVRSTPGRIDPTDILVSLKTSSKDRYSKMLVDNMIAEKITERPMKLLAVFHNDVQRTLNDGVSVTFLAQQYLVYTQYLSRPSGVYYVDPPGHSLRQPWSSTIKPIEDLFLNDLWTL
jgi:hypothetical protein